MIIKTFLTYYLFNSIEYVFHKLGHYRHKYNYIYNLHSHHHKKHYTITRLVSDTYEHNNEGIIAYVPPIMIVLYSLYLGLDSETFNHVFIQLVIHSFVNDYIHTQIHIRNSWLERYDWFRESRRLHFIHHNKLNYNMSFGFDYTFDKLNGTYLEK